VKEVNGECRCPTADRCRRVLGGLPLSDNRWPVAKLDFDALPDPPALVRTLAPGGNGVGLTLDELIPTDEEIS
jgi:hypothetical protein